MTDYTPAIGTKWLDRNNRECTVFDIYTTTSIAGSVVEVRYVSWHQFAGQRVESVDSQVTVGRGMRRLRDAVERATRRDVHDSISQTIPRI